MDSSLVSSFSLFCKLKEQSFLFVSYEINFHFILILTVFDSFLINLFFFWNLVDTNIIKKIAHILHKNKTKKILLPFFFLLFVMMRLEFLLKKKKKILDLHSTYLAHRNARCSFWGTVIISEVIHIFLYCILVLYISAFQNPLISKYWSPWYCGLTWQLRTTAICLLPPPSGIRERMGGKKYNA